MFFNIFYCEKGNMEHKMIKHYQVDHILQAKHWVWAQQYFEKATKTHLSKINFYKCYEVPSIQNTVYTRDTYNHFDNHMPVAKNCWNLEFVIDDGNLIFDNKITISLGRLTKNILTSSWPIYELLNNTFPEEPHLNLRLTKLLGSTCKTTTKSMLHQARSK